MLTYTGLTLIYLFDGTGPPSHLRYTGRRGLLRSSIPFYLARAIQRLSAMTLNLVSTLMPLSRLLKTGPITIHLRCTGSLT